MDSTKEEKKPLYIVKCTRCRSAIETLTQPGPKSTGFLCNSCHLKWKEIEMKLDGHAYADEKREAFIKFLNSLPYLRNI